MTRIWLVNWHFQSRITLWCRHKSTNVSMGLCWQMPKFIVWRLWSIYFDHHLLLKPSIGKRRKESCTPNIFFYIFDKTFIISLTFLVPLYANTCYTALFDKGNIPNRNILRELHIRRHVFEWHEDLKMIVFSYSRCMMNNIFHECIFHLSASSNVIEFNAAHLFYRTYGIYLCSI